MVAACSSGESKPPVLSSDGDSDVDIGGDADSDADSDSDADVSVLGRVCTLQNAATVCGANVPCVEGYCCDAKCTGTCASCALAGSEGRCSAVAADTVCRPAATPCDIEEICDGTAKVCPADAFLAAGDPCGDQTDNDCDNPNTCSADGICLPNYEVAGGACTDLSGACKVDPHCDGAGLCTSDVDKPDDIPCGDQTHTTCNHPDICIAGGCRPRYVPAGKPCGDETNTECNLADMCDGAGECAENLMAAGTPCGDTDTSECDQADQCDGAGVCDPRFVADETACGDSTSDECNHPDSCLSGECAANYEADGTVCNDGETSVVYRCSDTDCSATPQQQVVGWTCTTGACTEVLTPTWDDVAAACTVSQVCATDGTSYAECVQCDQPGLNECIDNVATGYAPAGVCSIDDGVPACSYEPIEEDCTLNVDGKFNCVEGACTNFSCEPGEKDVIYGWGSTDDGWTLGNWGFDSQWPWADSDAPYLKLVIPATGAVEADTYLISPEMGLYACSTGTASFNITFTDQYANCSPRSYLALECGADTEWMEIWSKEEVPETHTNPQNSKEYTLEHDVDITPCLGKTEVHFRFSVKNLCDSHSISDVFVDNFSISAVQENSSDTEADADTGTVVDTAADTDTGTGTIVDTGTGTVVDTATDTDTGTGTVVDTGTGTVMDTGTDTAK